MEDFTDKSGQAFLLVAFVGLVFGAMVGLWCTKRSAKRVEGGNNFERAAGEIIV